MALEEAKPCGPPAGEQAPGRRVAARHPRPAGRATWCTRQPLFPTITRTSSQYIMKHVYCTRHRRVGDASIWDTPGGNHHAVHRPFATSNLSGQRERVSWQAIAKQQTRKVHNGRTMSAGIRETGARGDMKQREQTQGKLMQGCIAETGERLVWHVCHFDSTTCSSKL